LTKQCTKCFIDLPLDAFYKSKKIKSGLLPSCKKCCQTNSKIYRLNNQKKVLENKKQYRLKNKTTILIQDKKYRQANQERINAYLREYSKQYRIEHPEVAKLSKQKRRANKLNNGIYRVTHKELKSLCAKACFYCGSFNNIEIDHVIPLARGGSHSVGNLVAACVKCNRSKGSKFVTEWRKK
jgi:5-methylcytosine-specific restriction endonuclease McrA